MRIVKKCTRKCTARNDRDEGSGMKASECSLGNEGLGTESWEGFGMESREWNTVIVTCRMILPFEDMKELYI